MNTDYLTILYSEKQAYEDTMGSFECDLPTVIQLIRNVRLLLLDEDLLEQNRLLEKNLNITEDKKAR